VRCGRDDQSHGNETIAICMHDHNILPLYTCLLSMSIFIVRLPTPPMMVARLLVAVVTLSPAISRIIPSIGFEAFPTRIV